MLLLSTMLIPPPTNPTRVDVSQILRAPSLEHPGGTDRLGRCVMSRTMVGIRVTTAVALSAEAVAFLTSLAAGASALSRGALGSAIPIAVGALLAIPPFILALGLRAVLGASPLTLVAALALASVGYQAQLARGEFRAAFTLPHVEAARALGAAPPRLLRSHVLPGLMPVLLRYSLLDFGSLFAISAVLEYIGLGPAPPAPSIGGLLSEGKDQLAVHPWIFWVPGIGLAWVLLCVNRLVAGLRAGEERMRDG